MTGARPLFFLLLLFAVLSGSLARADTLPPLLLTDTTGKTELAPWLHYNCPDRPLSLAEARQLDFQRIPGQRVAFGYRHQHCWFHFRLHNSSTSALDLMLTLDFAMLDHTRLYQLGPLGVSEQVVGDVEPWQQRRLRTRLFSYPLILAPGESGDYYLQVHTTSSMNLPLAVMDRSTFIEEQFNKETVLGIFYGIGVGLVLYNLSFPRNFVCQG